jgi:SPP1 gp7 family putative phage head morphogenesis protein
MDNLALIERVKKVLVQATEEGCTQEEGLERLNAAFDAEGVERLDAYHLDLLWQMGTTTAYSQRRMTQMSDPDVVLALPFWRYRTMEDTSVRPNHAALNMFVARYDDPVWNRILPPLGFNCRCMVESLLRGEGAQILGDQLNVPGDKRLPPGAGPDQGFDRTPWAFLRILETTEEYDEFPDEDDEGE